MTPLETLIAEVERAMEGIHHAGPWEVGELVKPRRSFSQHWEIQNKTDIFCHVYCGMDDPEAVKTVAAYIASGNPANIRLILDALTAERQARERAEDELAEVRSILAGADISSLPRDYGTAAMAANRMDDLIKYVDQVRDTCARSEAAESASEQYRLYAAEKSNQYVAAQARLKEAEKVIAPFAKLAGEFGLVSTSRTDAQELFGFRNVELTYGHFRAAAAFLNNKEAENGNQ